MGVSDKNEKGRGVKNVHKNDVLPSPEQEEMTMSLEK